MKMKCPHCGISGKAPSPARSRLARCPRCRELFLLPEREEIPQETASAGQIEVNEERRWSFPPEGSVPSGVDEPHQIFAQTETGPVDDDVLVDESWLKEAFTDDVPGLEPDGLSGMSDESGEDIPEPAAESSGKRATTDWSEGSEDELDWRDDSVLETGEGLEDEEELEQGSIDNDRPPEDPDGFETGARAETSGEKRTESSDYHEPIEDIDDLAEDPPGPAHAEVGESEAGSVFPDFSETLVNWKGQQPKPENDAAGATREQAAEAGDDRSSPSAPIDEVIERELDEMLAETCVSCDTRVEEDELYCPSCLEKKRSGVGGSAEATSDGTGEGKAGRKKAAFWIAIALLAVLLAGYLLLKLDLV